VWPGLVRAACGGDRRVFRSNDALASAQGHYVHAIPFPDGLKTALKASHANDRVKPTATVCSLRHRVSRTVRLTEARSFSPSVTVDAGPEIDPQREDSGSVALTRSASCRSSRRAFDDSASRNAGSCHSPEAALPSISPSATAK